MTGRVWSMVKDRNEILFHSLYLVMSHEEDILKGRLVLWVLQEDSSGGGDPYQLHGAAGANSHQASTPDFLD
jgi:hypothetical protein